jgi:hypothetical protein
VNRSGSCRFGLRHQRSTSRLLLAAKVSGMVSDGVAGRGQRCGRKVRRFNLLTPSRSATEALNLLAVRVKATQLPSKRECGASVASFQSVGLYLQTLRLRSVMAGWLLLQSGLLHILICLRDFHMMGT